MADIYIEDQQKNYEKPFYDQVNTEARPHIDRIHAVNNCVYKYVLFTGKNSNVKRTEKYFIMYIAPRQTHCLEVNLETGSTNIHNEGSSTALHIGQLIYIGLKINKQVEQEAKVCIHDWAWLFPDLHWFSAPVLLNSFVLILLVQLICKN